MHVDCPHCMATNNLGPKFLPEPHVTHEHTICEHCGSAFVFTLDQIHQQQPAAKAEPAAA